MFSFELINLKWKFEFSNKINMQMKVRQSPFIFKWPVRRKLNCPNDIKLQTKWKESLISYLDIGHQQ